MTITFPEGLSSQEAAARQHAEGVNEIDGAQQHTLLRMIGEILREPMFLLLLSAGAIYLAIGDTHEAMVLLGFVVVIMVITLVQQQRTEHSLDALRDLSSPRALVIRDKVATRIAGRDVVRGDIVMLAEGDRVPADGLVIQAHDLATDESLLTGESVPLAKFSDINQVYAGTLVVRGQGLMRVTDIGHHTALGRIGKSLGGISLETSPLHREISRLARHLALAGTALCFALALLYWMLRGTWLDGLLAGITLAMGILPQEFPVVMIIFFALGARRIATQRVLTRRLNAIETLGETTVLCVDKTGTLTQNRMAIAALCVDGHIFDIARLADAELPEEYHELLEYAVLASEIDPHDPMERAFRRFAHQYLANTEHLHNDWILAREYELSPQLMAMSHLWQKTSATPQPDAQDIVAAKGSPEAIADLCHMQGKELHDVKLLAEQMAARGLRLLGVAKATRKAGAVWPDNQHHFDFKFIGILGLADPLRSEVPAAVDQCRRAGIRVVMITGDHPSTARAIAAQAGIDHNDVLSGDELLQLDATRCAEKIASVSIFARITAQQKLQIVETLKKHGEVVAMTGDGVNDAPALKAAHIGIAMGKRGTDAAREAAALVLLEDDFSAIVSAIQLGRRTFANLRQALIYTVAVHVPIILLSILPLLFGWPLIFAPIHIAFLELLIDPACSIVFEAEKNSTDLMNNKPRAPAEPLVSLRHMILALAQGLLIALAVIVFYHWLLAQGTITEVARTLAFITLVTANAALILPARRTQVAWHKMARGLSSVGIMVLTGTGLALVLISHIPVIASAFSFYPPSLQQSVLAFGVGASLLLPFELTKIFFQTPPHRPISS